MPKKKPETIKVRSYKREGPGGKEIKVSSYERLKSEPDRNAGHPGMMLEATTKMPVKGTKIVTRDPSRAQPAQPLKGVQIFGRAEPGVKRVSR